MRGSYRQTIILAFTGGLLCQLASIAIAQAGGTNAGGFGASYGYEAWGMRGGSVNGYYSGGISGGSVSGASATELREQNEQSQGQIPPVPTSKKLALFTDQQLQSFIAQLANGFTNELGQFSTGDTWVKYLRLDDLRALALRAPGENATAETSDNITSAQSQDVISTVLDRINSAEKNSEYKPITNSWRFQALQAALKEAARSPQEREPGVLTGQAELLSKSLERLSTGDGWRKHLEIDALEKIADKKNLESNNELKRIEERFDQTAHNPEYQAIAHLPAFNGVYSTLRILTEGKQFPATAKKEPSPSEKSTRK